jgi:hypothetical protein
MLSNKVGDRDFVVAAYIVPAKTQAKLFHEKYQIPRVFLSVLCFPHRLNAEEIG